MNKLLLYLLLVLIMILFAHILDSNKKTKSPEPVQIREKFDIGVNYETYNNYEKYIGSVVRLKVKVPILNTYTNNFNELNENKYFYLACVKLNPNCNVVNVNNSCIPIFVDHKKCGNNGLSIESNKDTYRLVLLHESQIDMPDLSDTCNFVFERVNDKVYLKNIQNGHYPRLFTNNVYVSIIGNPVDINKNKNMLCAGSIGNTTDNSGTTIGVHNLDGNTYLLSTMDSNTSSPVKLTFGNSMDSDVVSIQFEKYNNYGQVYDYYDLIYTNNVETSSIYTINTVSIDNYIKRIYPSNSLQFMPEIISPSPEYIKSMYVKEV